MVLVFLHACARVIDYHSMAACIFIGHLCGAALREVCLEPYLTKFSLAVFRSGIHTVRVLCINLFRTGQNMHVFSLFLGKFDTAW